MHLDSLVHFLVGISAECQLIHQVHHIHALFVQTVKLKSVLVLILFNKLAVSAGRLLTVFAFQLLPSTGLLPDRPDLLITGSLHRACFLLGTVTVSGSNRAQIIAICLLIAALMSLDIEPRQSIDWTVLARHVVSLRTGSLVWNLDPDFIDKRISLPLDVLALAADAADAHVRIDPEFVAQTQLLILAFE